MLGMLGNLELGSYCNSRVRVLLQVGREMFMWGLFSDPMVMFWVEVKGQ